MEKWEQALEKFLRPWRSRPQVVGALVAGSYVAGTADDYSDVDVHIVLAANVRWRRKGLKTIDGVLIEYFANPIRQLKADMAEEHSNGERSTARMFATGKVVFDKSGAVRRFQKTCQKEMKRKFKKQDRVEIEIGKYNLWDGLDELKSLKKQALPGFEYAYYVLLHEILKTYAQFLGAEVWAVAKTWKFFRNSRYRRQYQLAAFPDSRFASIFLAAVSTPSISRIESLTRYAQTQMGGFETGNWTLRTPVRLTGRKQATLIPAGVGERQDL